MKRVRVVVAGRVQGVCYRACARDAAIALGLTGVVRNLPDGRVELTAEGPPDALKQIVVWCRQGSPAARVDEVEVNWEETDGSFTGFRVTY